MQPAAPFQAMDGTAVAVPVMLSPPYRGLEYERGAVSERGGGG
jgi:hypothetical protein